MRKMPEAFSDVTSERYRTLVWDRILWLRDDDPNTTIEQIVNFENDEAAENFLDRVFTSDQSKAHLARILNVPEAVLFSTELLTRAEFIDQVLEQRDHMQVEFGEAEPLLQFHLDTNTSFQLSAVFVTNLAAVRDAVGVRPYTLSSAVTKSSSSGFYDDLADPQNELSTESFKAMADVLGLDVSVMYRLLTEEDRLGPGEIQSYALESRIRE